MTSDAMTRSLLLVEDNPADADLVVDLLDQANRDNYDVTHVMRIAEALEILRTRQVDIVLLDLRLPDGSGLDTVRSVREVADDVPIVVLTGIDDEETAIGCIDIGAQDYLCKGDIRPVALRRTLGYAISRQREAKLRELQETLERYRALSSQSSNLGSVHSGSAIALRDRNAETFAGLVKDYISLLDAYVDRLSVRRDKPRTAMDSIALRLGEAGGGPRDLLDLHLASLYKVAGGRTDDRSRSYVLEGRLLALEMMGLLVDYYRMGGPGPYAAEALS
ncbi:response regulator [bacterium]|nr:response regulator [bacterium]